MIRCYRHQTESGSSPLLLAIFIAAAFVGLTRSGNRCDAAVWTGADIFSPYRWSRPGNWDSAGVPTNDGTERIEFGNDFLGRGHTEIDLDFHAYQVAWSGNDYHELRQRDGATLVVSSGGIRVNTFSASKDVDVVISGVKIVLSANSYFRTLRSDNTDIYGSLLFGTTTGVERIHTEGFDLRLVPGNKMPITFLSYEIHGAGTLIIDGEPSGEVLFYGGATKNFHRGGTILQSGILRRVSAFDPFGQDGKPLTFESSQGKLAIGSPVFFSQTLNHGDHPIILSSDFHVPHARIDVSDQWGYVIDSPISGSGSLVKTGLGDLTLTGANSYTGQTLVTAGRLLLNGTNAVPGDLVIDGPGGTAVRILQPESINDNASVTINAPAKFNLLNKTQTIGSLSGDGPLFMGLGTTWAELIVKAGNYSGRISENGNFKKIGSGTLTLTGANTYTGGATIDGGTLSARNTIGSATGTGPVQVNSGAALGGTGSVAGIVTVASGGALAPGASPGILTVGDVVFESGSIFSVELAGSGGVAGIDFDQLVVEDTANLGGDLVVDLTGGFVPEPGNEFTILTSANVFGTFDNVLHGERLATSDGIGSFLVHYVPIGMFNTRRVTLTDFLLAAVPGDYNQNGTVDAADYVVWRKGLGTVYTQSDYAIWRANFGRTAGSGAALPSAESLSAAVPEPATWTLLNLAASVHLRRRQWSRAPQNSST